MAYGKNMNELDKSGLERYSVITDKNPREIVLLRGTGCKWLKCRFCNYHLDKCLNESENFILNQSILSNITGEFGKLEIINSGSFVDLDINTMNYILEKCIEKKIKEIHFECHYMHKDQVSSLRKMFNSKNIDVKIKIGVETFDSLFRESYLMKGITTDSPEEISKYFDEVCLLQGLPGQTIESMTFDIETGLKYFERVCVNIMVENGMPIHPDTKVIRNFINYIYPIYKDNIRVDILLNNTDFGIG